MFLLKAEGNKNKPIAKEKVSFLFTNGKKFSDRQRFLQSGRNGSKGAILSEDLSLRPCSTDYQNLVSMSELGPSHCSEKITNTLHTLALQNEWRGAKVMLQTSTFKSYYCNKFTLNNLFETKSFYAGPYIPSDSFFCPKFWHTFTQVVGPAWLRLDSNFNRFHRREGNVGKELCTCRSS